MKFRALALAATFITGSGFLVSGALGKINSQLPQVTSATADKVDPHVIRIQITNPTFDEAMVYVPPPGCQEVKKEEVLRVAPFSKGAFDIYLPEGKELAETVTAIHRGKYRFLPLKLDQ